MKKLVAVLMALLIPFSFAHAELFHQTNAITISFDTEEGCAWTCSILFGDSVVCEKEDGTYAVIEWDSEPPEAEWDFGDPEVSYGSGAQTHFTLIPVKTGEGIVAFTRTRGGEPDGECLVLTDVEDDLLLFVYDVTDGVLEGTVTSIDEFEHRVIVETESYGDVLGCLLLELQLPAIGEKIVLYTAGINANPDQSLSATVVAWKPAE